MDDSVGIIPFSVSFVNLYFVGGSLFAYILGDSMFALGILCMLRGFIVCFGELLPPIFGGRRVSCKAG